MLGRVIQRELKIAFRSGAEVVNPLWFSDCDYAVPVRHWP